MQVIAAGAGADSFSSVTTHNVLSERVNLETATTIETVSRPETCEDCERESYTLRNTPEYLLPLFNAPECILRVRQN